MHVVRYRGSLMRSCQGRVSIPQHPDAVTAAGGRRDDLLYVAGARNDPGGRAGFRHLEP